MKARMSVTLKTESVEDAQRLLMTICEGLVASGSIGDYCFEIETDRGVVTEKCILSEGGVIA
jgi:phosphoribosylformylglycinamidine (FGAM) synthase PurS component